MKKITLFLCLISFLATAQNYKFGKVSKEELEEQFYPKDSSVNAAILFKNRRTYFDYTQSDGFFVITEVHERIKIYNKEGYDWATKEIRYYTSSSSGSEKVTVSTAKTFRLEDGKIKSYKLKKGGVFLEKENKYWSKKIFTMPNLTEGCVVEWKYKLISPYKGIDKLNFQYSIPVKRIQCKIEIPEYYIFNLRYIGFEKTSSKKYVKGGVITITNKDRSNRWMTGSVFSSSDINYKINVMEVSKDFMPALKEELYVSNINNYRTSIKFELSSVRWPNRPIKNFSKSWDNVSKTILANSSFGGELKKKLYFKKDLELLKVASGNQKELVDKIFNFVKEKVKWNGYNGLYTDKGVKVAYKKGTGNIAEINLILTAMLRDAGITANPVLVSTRSHGVPVFPTIEGFNYVVVGVGEKGGIVLLDASEKYSTPDVLPFRTLNWKGRIIRDDKTSSWVPLIPLEHSKKEYMISAVLNDNEELSGFVRTKFSNRAALRYRKTKNALSEDELLEEIDEKYEDIDVLLAKVKFREDIYKPVVESLKFTSEDLLEEINGDVFIKPLLFLGETTNPFKMDERVYPIDYGSPWTTNYKVSIKIPGNYKVVSIPESVKLEMEEGIGSFLMQVKEQNGTIRIFVSLSMNTGMIHASKYKMLKDFYRDMLKKINEKIVLKKV
ncbi:MAG: DUF3857 domain-containing protein [Flavobacteriaceae bacterium]|nr:DUF3857 domain-containing protein [Flavobacteriaceae bacterium]